jgi:hypothetical protein
VELTSPKSWLTILNTAGFDARWFQVSTNQVLGEVAMAVLKKIAGLAAGISAVAVIGVAVAQGVPPNPFVTNPALGAGQQSSHLTSMGETGVPGLIDQVQTAQITTVREVARVQEPAPVVAQAQAPAPAAPVVEQQQMGAAPAPAAEPAPMAPKQDRN